MESELTQGYRIQIFATGNFDEANAMRETAVQRLTEDSVYSGIRSPRLQSQGRRFPHAG